MRALYEYRGQAEDELSFPKDAIITNVKKQDDDWWLGDYGGKKELLFPANYTQEIEVMSENPEENVSYMLLKF